MLIRKNETNKQNTLLENKNNNNNDEDTDSHVHSPLGMFN